MFQSEPTEITFESYDMAKSIFLHIFPPDNVTKNNYNGLKNDVVFYKIEENSGCENITVKFYSLDHFILKQLPKN